MKYSRHQLDQEVFEFVIDKFKKNFNNNDSCYISADDKVIISIWKNQFYRNEQIEIFFTSPPTSDFFDKKYVLRYKYTELLKTFFENLDDKENQTYLKNENKDMKLKLESWK